MLQTLRNIPAALKRKHKIHPKRATTLAITTLCVLLRILQENMVMRSLCRTYAIWIMCSLGFSEFRFTVNILILKTVTIATSNLNSEERFLTIGRLCLRRGRDSNKLIERIKYYE